MDELDADDVAIAICASYSCRVEQVNGEFYNVEFATIEAVKDPFHGGKK